MAVVTAFVLGFMIKVLSFSVYFSCNTGLTWRVIIWSDRRAWKWELSKAASQLLAVGILQDNIQTERLTRLVHTRRSPTHSIVPWPNLSVRACCCNIRPHVSQLAADDTNCFDVLWTRILVRRTICLQFQQQPDTKLFRRRLKTLMFSRT